MSKNNTLPGTPTNPQVQSLEPAQRQARTVLRGGGISFLVLAAWWGVAAALFQWGTPVAGQVALLIGAVLSHPITWLILKLLGGPAWLPKTNPLRSLALANAAIPVATVLAAMAMATKIPEAFFACAMVGWACAALPDATLYGMRVHWGIGGLLLLVPVLLWFAIPNALPWAGLIGIIVFLLAGPLILRAGSFLPAQGSGQQKPGTGQSGQQSFSGQSSKDSQSSRGTASTQGPPTPPGSKQSSQKEDSQAKKPSTDPKRER